MQIENIKLEKFRNYDDQSIKVESGINVFFGDNAQGKTNILEAIYLCACARSHRTSKDTDLIFNGSDQYLVTIDYINDNGSKDTLSIQYLDSVSGDSKRSKAVRHIFHNGLKVERISDLMGLFHAVIFAPEDLMLVKEGPSTRRRFIDLLISQLRPSYFKNLQLYSRLLAQRNRLLKELKSSNNKIKENDPMMIQLEVWTSSLCETAASIIKSRFEFIERISIQAEKSLFQISSGKEKLIVKYKTLNGLSIDMSKKDVSDKLYYKLKSIVYDDINRGNTSYGPHRDDLELWLNGEPLKPYASQGQQRSVVLSLKMSELNIIKEDINEYPVLLLDDVMSELDINRRGCLLAGISEAQVFVTCTEAEHVVQEMELACKINDENCKEDKSERLYSFYKVESGNVYPTE